MHGERIIDKTRKKRQAWTLAAWTTPAHCKHVVLPCLIGHLCSLPASQDFIAPVLSFSQDGQFIGVMTVKITAGWGASKRGWSSAGWSSAGSMDGASYQIMKSWFLVCQRADWSMVVRTCHCFVQFLAQTSWIYCIIEVYFGSIWPAFKKLVPSSLSFSSFWGFETQDIVMPYIVWFGLIWYFKISFISYLYVFLLSFPYANLTCRGGSDGGRRRCEGCSKAWGESGQGTCEETPVGLLDAKFHRKSKQPKEQRSKSLKKNWYDSLLSIHLMPKSGTFWHFGSFFEAYPS